MGDFTRNELEAYDPFIDASIACVFEMIKDGVDENDPRIIQLAAAKAYKSIALCASEKMVEKPAVTVIAARSSWRSMSLSYSVTMPPA